jgi:hypothetical protein
LVLTWGQVVGAVVLLAGAAIVQVAAGRRIEPDTPPALCGLRPGSPWG